MFIPFTIGIIVGMMISISAMLAVLYFRYPVTRVINQAEQKYQGFRPTGDIYMPESEAESKRQKIVKKNQKQGRSTPIRDLQP